MEQHKDLRYYWRVFLDRKKYFIWPALAIVLISAIVALALPPIFESASTILIEQQQIPPDFVRSTVTGYADQRIQSLNQQILSRTRLLEIIRQFNLYAAMREKYSLEEVIEKMREDIAVNLISAEVSDRKRGGKAGTQGVTIAFTVAYRGKNPNTVQQVASTLASLYLQENLKIREQQAKTTTKFLEAELKELSERIKTIGAKITEFKEKHEGLQPELQQFNRAQAERLEREIDQLNVQTRAAEDRKIYLEGQLATVKPDTPMISATGERVMDPQSRLKALEVALCDLQSRYSDDHPDICKVKREIKELQKMSSASGGSPSLKRQKLTQLKAELAQKQGRYSDQHPEVIKLKKEIAELEKIPESVGPAKPVTQPENPAYVNLLTNIQAAGNDINALKRQKGELAAKLKVYRQRLEEAPKVEQEYLALTRNYQNAHVKHQEIMDKILEARIAEGMEESQKAEKFTIIDPASYPEQPVAPRRGLIFLAGLILSLGAGLGMVALTENLDHSIKSADELAWLTGLPVLGSITRIVTPEDVARKKQRRRVIWILTGLSLLAVVILFHFFVMDLWIFAAKLGRFTGKYL
ncbi:MAG: GNVR domain-containing protein [Syntrophobacterales bacterium]